MIHNPNAASPRTLRDCTFCDWADPIERPAPAAHWSIRLYVWALCAAALVTVAWRLT